MNIFITGGASGIGKDIALRLLEQGHRVLICYNGSEKSAKEIKSKYSGAEIFKADLSEKGQAELFFNYGIDKFGDIDALINNAAISVTGCFQSVSDRDFERLMEINFNCVYKLCALAAPYMIKKKSGNIINIASMWGVKGASCEALYSASKGAVITLTQALAAELGASGIRVNSVSPGVIDTTMNAHLNSEDKTQLKDQTPLGRLGTGEDIASICEFLISDKSAFITGQNIVADGGFLLS